MKFTLLVASFLLFGGLIFSSCEDEKEKAPVEQKVEPPKTDTLPQQQEVPENNFDELFPVADSLRASEVDKLLKLYANGYNAQRDSLRQTVNDSVMSNRLLHYGYTSAVEGVRLQNPPLLKNGLMALSLNNSTGGFRESIRGCALLWYSHLKINAPALPHFEEVSAVSTPEFAALLTDFAQRDEELKDIRNFGYIDVNSPEFNYVYFGFSIVSDTVKTDTAHALFLNN